MANLLILLPPNDHFPVIVCPVDLAVELQQAGLMGKLVHASVAEESDGLAFSEGFRTYLATCNRGQYLKLDRMKGWRIILTYFDSSLDSLLEGEIAVVVALIEYFGLRDRYNIKSISSRVT